MSEITTVEIKLSRFIREDGRMCWKIHTPDNYNAIEALGLLAAGILHVFNEVNDYGRNV